MTKKILMIARDAAPSGCFKRLAEALQESGYKTTLIIGDGKPLPVSLDLEMIKGHVAQADLVILGMSSSRELAEPEIIAGEAARELSIPYGFYGDVPGCWKRAREGAWFQDLAQNAAFYFGISQEDCEAAAQVFPEASLVGAGNPLREDMAFPKYTKGEIRQQLGIGEDEAVVLISGGKFAAGNMATLLLVIDALKLLKHTRKYHIIFSPHPGDRACYAIDCDTEKPLGLYEAIATSSPIPLSIIYRTQHTTSDMVPAADLVIEFGSSIGIEAGYQRIPVITLGLEMLYRKLEEESGARVLEAVDNGVSRPVSANLQELANVIDHFITGGTPPAMRNAQERMYVIPEKRGQVIRTMVDALDEIVNTQKVA